MFGFKKAKKKQEELSKSSQLTFGLSRSRHKWVQQLSALLTGKKHIDEALLKAIETQLILSDMGIKTTQSVLEVLKRQADKTVLDDPKALLSIVCHHLEQQLVSVEQPLCLPADVSPYVILMIGVNGAGKTTTIGKLATYFQKQGKSVLLAAGDTFRAAAIEQLQTWGNRQGIPVVAQSLGADSAAVIYDAFQSAIARKADILIADTAGRLQTKVNLLEELKKIKRVLSKLDSAAPHEVMLVLDATTGQNALKQAQVFHEAIQVTGLTIAKLDGTAKGGVIFSIAESLNLPIRFIGLGEAPEDIQPFLAKPFVQALFDQGLA